MYWEGLIKAVVEPGLEHPDSSSDVANLSSAIFVEIHPD